LAIVNQFWGYFSVGLDRSRYGKELVALGEARLIVLGLDFVYKRVIEVANFLQNWSLKSSTLRANRVTRTMSF